MNPGQYPSPLKHAHGHYGKFTEAGEKDPLGSVLQSNPKDRRKAPNGR